MISADGIKPNKEHMKKALELKCPENHKEVQSLLGFFNYFRDFIYNFSEKSLFLTEKLKDEKIEWSENDNLNLKDLKNELLSEPILQPYDSNKELTIETDASQRAVGAIVTQNRKPVYFLSKKLTSVQKNWSNIEREAYAVYWAITKLRHFLLGRKFCVKTDHRPLEFIYAEKKGIPTRTSARVARWALELMPYDFEIFYKPGSSIPHVDMLSRLSDNEESESIFEVEEPFTDHSLISEIKRFSESNRDYQRLIERIKDNKWSKTNKAERQMFRYRWELTVENNIIYKRTKFFIPGIFRENVLQTAHETHQGKLAMLNCIKNEFWWPNSSLDVMVFLKQCKTCAKNSPIKKSFLSTWPTSKRWERIHIDWAMPDNFGPVLIIVDAATNYIDAIPCANRGTETVKRCLARLFGFFGLPLTVVSDNAPEFVALRQWLRNMGIFLVNTPPYNPASNGQAERAV